MGVAIYFIVQAIFGVACLIGIGVGGHILLGRVARPESRDTARVMVWALMVMVAIAALVWGSQLETRQAPNAFNWEKHYCSEAGEKIYRSVDNVKGIFYVAPALRSSGGRFHSDDGRPESFLRRPERRYEFLEVRRAATNQLVERHDLKDGKTVSSRTDSLTARYGFTWTPLESIDESNAGLHGEELEVYDRETSEVLGRRVLYYRDADRGATSHGVPLAVCPQVVLRTDPAYIDGQPRDSYDFVARVLKPTAPASEESARLFDLRRGGGRKSKECVGGYVWIGEGIEPKDLAFERRGQDLIMTVKGASDELHCRGYFFSEDRGSRSYRLRFAGGSLISQEELWLKMEPKNGKK